MKKNYFLNKFILNGVFFICLIFGITFISEKANASDENSNVVADYSESGTCGGANFQTLAAMPNSNDLCLSGTASEVTVTNMGWKWSCYAKDAVGTSILDSVSSMKCSAISSAALMNPVASEPIGSCGSANGRVLTTKPTESSALCFSGSMTNMTIDSDGWSWMCTTSAEVEPVSCSAQLYKYQSLTSGDAGSMGQVDTLSQVIVPSMVVAAKNLAPSNNPKISGDFNAGFKIQSVALKTDEIGNRNVDFNGSADPDTIINLYVFSQDPVVVSLRTDVNGDWNYTLDKEIADGQHEVYVAVADDAGKIITKSEPIAFVKTAEAATMIPMSQFNANQSPIENSSSQYVTIALIIVSVFLIIAIILIGYLSYKQKMYEEIY